MRVALWSTLTNTPVGWLPTALLARKPTGVPAFTAPRITSVDYDGEGQPVRPWVIMCADTDNLTGHLAYSVAQGFLAADDVHVIPTQSFGLSVASLGRDLRDPFLARAMADGFANEAIDETASVLAMLDQMVGVTDAGATFLDFWGHDG